MLVNKDGEAFHGKLRPLLDPIDIAKCRSILSLLEAIQTIFLSIGFTDKNGFT